MASNLRRHITKTHIVRYDSNFHLIDDSLLTSTSKGALTGTAPWLWRAEGRSQKVSEVSGEV